MCSHGTMYDYDQTRWWLYASSQWPNRIIFFKTRPVASLFFPLSKCTYIYECVCACWTSERLKVWAIIKATKKLFMQDQTFSFSLSRSYSLHSLHSYSKTQFVHVCKNCNQSGPIFQKCKRDNVTGKPSPTIYHLLVPYSVYAVYAPITIHFIMNRHQTCTPPLNIRHKWGNDLFSIKTRSVFFLVPFVVQNPPFFFSALSLTSSHARHFGVSTSGLFFKCLITLICLQCFQKSIMKCSPCIFCAAQMTF